MDFKYVPSTCPYCGNGCGVNLVVRDGRFVGISPWHRNPVNEGKVCIRGNKSYEFVSSPDRLVAPLIKKDGKFVEARLGRRLQGDRQCLQSGQGRRRRCCRFRPEQQRGLICLKEFRGERAQDSKHRLLRPALQCRCGQGPCRCIRQRCHHQLARRLKRCKGDPYRGEQSFRGEPSRRPQDHYRQAERRKDHRR